MNELNARPPLPYDHRLEEPVTVGHWIKTNLIMMVPLVGIVAVFYWAFSAHTNSSKRNYMRALLLTQLVAVIFVFAILAFFHGVRDAILNASSRTTLSVPSVSQPESTTPMRILQGIDGRTIEAAVIGFTRPGHVQIRRVDGKVFTIEESKFSAEDIAYFNELRAALESP